MTTATKVEPTIKSLEIVRGYQPFNASFKVWVLFNDLPGKTEIYRGLPTNDCLTVEVDYEHGIYIHNQTLRVGLTSDNYKFAQRTGINGVGQVKGLKKRCIELCDEFRARFKPTPEQLSGMLEGKLDKKFSLVLKSSTEAHVTFADLAIGEWLFDGILEVKPVPNGDRLSIAYTSHGGTRLWEHECRKRHEAGDYSYGYISRAARDVIYEYIRPAVDRLWAWSFHQRRDTARKELEQSIRNMEQQIEFDTTQLERHQEELAQLKSRLAASTQEEPCTT